jgi:hypothetical protein
MARRLSRPRTKPRPPTRHSPERRKFLKGAWVAATALYVGDKALGGLISNAATNVATRALTPAPTARVLSIGLDGGVYSLATSSDSVSLALSEASSTVIPETARDDA